MKRVYDSPVILFPIAMSRLTRISKTARLVFDALIFSINEDNGIILRDDAYQTLARLIHITSSKTITIPTIRNAVTELNKYRLLLRLRPKVYVVNPLLCIRYDQLISIEVMINKIFEEGGYNPDLRQVGELISKDELKASPDQYLHRIYRAFPRHFNPDLWMKA